jgi:hypothetical protein
VRAQYPGACPVGREGSPSRSAPLEHRVELTILDKTSGYEQSSEIADEEAGLDRQ